MIEAAPTTAWNWRTRFRWLAPSCLLIPLLAGCATFHARPLRPEASAAALRQRSLSDPRLLRFVSLQLQRPIEHRWDLDALTLAALYERPDMPIAATQVEVAEAGEVTAREWPNRSSRCPPPTTRRP